MSLEEVGELGPGLALGFGYSFVGDLSAVCVHALLDVLVCAQGLLDAVVCQLHDVGECGVGEGQCRGVRNGGRDVGDAVVHDSTLGVGRIAVSGGMGGFYAASLINRYIYYDCAFLHLADHLAGDDFGGSCAGD